jgi:hypothetical protein
MAAKTRPQPVVKTTSTAELEDRQFVNSKGVAGAV